MKLEEMSQRDAQISAHNESKHDVRRIRMSWLVVVLMFLMIGLTAVVIMTRAYGG